MTTEAPPAPPINGAPDQTENRRKLADALAPFIAQMGFDQPPDPIAQFVGSMGQGGPQPPPMQPGMMDMPPPEEVLGGAGMLPPSPEALFGGGAMSDQSRAGSDYLLDDEWVLERDFNAAPSEDEENEAAVQQILAMIRAA